MQQLYITITRRWNKGYVHTWSTSYTWQLQFEVIRGGYDGDIAIDDIKLTDGKGLFYYKLLFLSCFAKN